MSFPGEKVHRPARRRPGRGQYPTPAPVTTNVMGAGAVITVQFSAPVILRGSIGFLLPGANLLSETIDTEQQVTLTYDSVVDNIPWQLPTPVPNAATRTGSQIMGESGEFMLSPNDVLHTAGGNYYPPPASVVQIGVQFGVGNTATTGTFNPPLPPLIQALTIANNGDGTYNITFSEAVTLTSMATDPAMQMWIPSFTSFAGMTPVSQIDASTIQYASAGNDPAGTYFVIQAVPTSVTAAHQFAFANLLPVP